MVSKKEEKTKIERHTELMVAKKMGLQLLEKKKYEKGQVYMQGEETGIANIDKALVEAGGKPDKCKIWEEGGKNEGKAQPEYIITFDSHPNTIIVVECKNSVKFHESSNMDSPKGYAVDGVLYYAKFLKRYFNVIALAVSGTEEEKCELTCFYWKKKEEAPKYVPEGRFEVMEPDWYLREIRRLGL